MERYIRDVLGPDLITIDRSSAVWLYNAYHDWPLTRASLLKLPPTVMARAGLDLFRRPQSRDESLESYILSRYGGTLYDIFFRPYTEKFLHYKCSELHRDWASAGINRAVIDKRLRFDSLWHVARTTLLPPKVDTKFLYPKTGGIDRFVESLADQIRAAGGTVLTGAPVEAVERSGDQVRSVVARGHDPVAADLVVWTASLPLLSQALDLGKVDLKYLAELIYNVTLHHESPLPYQWTYYGAATLSFTRASAPSRFNPRNSPPGRSGICVEVVCSENDELWQHPERLERDIAYDLVRVGLARGRESVAAFNVERITEAYPIYALDYLTHLDAAVDRLDTINNVALLGRTGTFWYNNMDHSIRQAIDLADALRDGTDSRRWNRDLRKSRAL